MADAYGKTARDALTDVPGIRVGHAQRIGDGSLTGTTVVLAPAGGAVAAVDVRGGGPGTRETDALDPRNLVQRVDAVVLTGGSAFGLDAATGVAAWLEEQGRGVRVGPDPTQVVPVVPTACLFDLGRGGDWRARPDATLGREAVQRAASDAGRGQPSGSAQGGGEDAPVTVAEDDAAQGSAAPGETSRKAAAGNGAEQGNVGAGAGAVAGGLKGGVGTAAVVLPSGAVVGALVVVNAVGSVVEPTTGALYGELMDGRAVLPAADRHRDARRRLAEVVAASGPPPLNTTLAVVATDAVLSKAQAQKMAGTAHDGLARAVRPVHLLHDGDTVFALATGTRPTTGPGTGDAGAGGSGPGNAGTAEEGTAGASTAGAGGTGGAGAADATSTGDPAGNVGAADGAGSPTEPGAAPVVGVGELNALLAAAADTLTRAVVKAVLAADSVSGPGGVFPSYRDLYGWQAAD